MYRRGGSKKDHHNKPVKEESESTKYAELLVFGYACKLFRDDERAHFHEQGKHLIPWMGDKSIMIDRYDGRGHLHDLSEYDADSWNRDYQLSEEEARIEALCDEERYLALHTDLLEEEARQEEEYKRLSEALADEGTFNAVGYRYSADYYDPSQPTEEEEANKEAEAQEDSEEPFVAPPGLIIPPDVELPATIKTHAIIERTANFVCKQGAQFEIVLKAKQAKNSQFDFLRFDHYLNPYYKHILRAMKECRYTPISDNQHGQQQDTQSDDSDDDGDGSYLHPSLMAPKKCSRLEELMKPLRVIDPDHPLLALVIKAQQEKNGGAAAAAAPAPAPPMVEETQPAVSTQAEYPTDPNVAPMYYGYCLLPDGTYCLAPPPPGIDANAYYSTLPHGMMPPQASAVPPPPGTTPPPEPVPIAPIPVPVSVSTHSQVTYSAPPSQITYSAPPTQITYSAPPTQITYSAPPTQITYSAPPTQVTYSAPPSLVSYSAPAVSTVTSVQPQAPVAPAVAPVAPAVAPVAPTVATPPPAVTTPPPSIIPPPPDIQPVIDKLAQYVARNGEKFEGSVRAKNDPRFDFLQSWHQYNTYYEFKKHYFMQKEGRRLPEVGPEAEDTDGSANGSSDKPPDDGKLIKASFAPISFAIKAKENDMLPLEKNRVRLDDDSDEERAAEGELEGGSSATSAGATSAGAVFTAAQAVKEASAAPPPEEKKPTLTLEELEAKQAKQKLEARLAAAAREKLAQASKESKEKQLQAERKRKAALFLQTLRGPDTDAKRPEETPAPPEPEVMPIMVAPATLSVMSRVPALPTEYQSSEVPAPRTSEAALSALSSAHAAPSSASAASASRGPEREKDKDRERDRERRRDRDKEKKKKKHKRRSRSRSRSRSKSKSKSKSKRGLPSAYRRLRRSRCVSASQSRSPGRRERKTRSPEWRREERERERHGPGTYRLGNSPGLGRKRSRSRSPHEKKKRKSSRSQVMKGSSRSPSASPDRPEEKRLGTVSASPSPPTSPTSRDGSQEKDKQVASAIVSSVQSKITQDLMAKVRAMLAASKTLPSNPS
ncbi:splicing factor, suppressor of white-apricot homolog isoform X1 [Alosa pseudoharengus]|uniref:splicing factor, suppressor of white-apricot homolog isoform X1 n=1 Tax=Alosa pseudoharengus TaxID=34774 RepID=UPI003F8BCF99